MADIIPFARVQDNRAPEDGFNNISIDAEQREALMEKILPYLKSLNLQMQNLTSYYADYVNEVGAKIGKFR